MTTYTNNLRIPYLDQNVAQPEVPENTAKNIIDQMFSNIYTVNATADIDINITQTDDPTAPTNWQSFMIKITDTSAFFTVERNVSLPNYPRSYIFMNSTLQSLTFKTSSGTGFKIAAGTTAYGYSDGTNMSIIEFTTAI